MEESVSAEVATILWELEGLPRDKNITKKKEIRKAHKATDKIIEIARQSSQKAEGKSDHFESIKENLVEANAIFGIHQAQAMLSSDRYCVGTKMAAGYKSLESALKTWAELFEHGSRENHNLLVAMYRSRGLAEHYNMGLVALAPA